jgi:hypothetical protein
MYPAAGVGGRLAGAKDEDRNAQFARMSSKDRLDLESKDPRSEIACRGPGERRNRAESSQEPPGPVPLSKNRTRAGASLEFVLRLAPMRWWMSCRPELQQTDAITKAVGDQHVDSGEDHCDRFAANGEYRHYLAVCDANDRDII